MPECTVSVNESSSVSMKARETYCDFVILNGPVAKHPNGVVIAESSQEKVSKPILISELDVNRG